jgi:hypothetical protein
MAKDDWQDDLRRRLSQAAIPQETIDAMRRCATDPAFDAMRRNIASFSESEAGRRLRELGDRLRSSTSRIGPIFGDGIQCQVSSAAAPSPHREPGKPSLEDRIKTEARRIFRIEGRQRNPTDLAKKVSENIEVGFSTAKKWIYPVWDEKTGSILS